MKYVKISIKGFIVGGSMLVPGVSGGSMAMILGIYDKLIESVSSFFKHPVESIKLLLAFSLSAIIGMLLCAKPLLHLIEKYPIVMMYFFMGAVIGSMPMIFRHAKVSVLHIKPFFCVVIGMLLMFGIAMLPENLMQIGNRGGIIDFIPMVLVGIVIAVALVLPGISVSYMLLVLGIYEKTMEAISKIDLVFLMPLFVGLMLGILLTTKLLDYAMTKYPLETYMMILGFIVASVIDVFPGVPSGIEVLLSFLMLACGTALIFKISEAE